MYRFLFLPLLIAFTLSLSAQITPPYFNNFDNLPADTLGWSHYSTFGVDDWEIGPTNYLLIPSAPSSPNVWATYTDAACAANSIRFLESPSFDFSGIHSGYYFAFDHKTHGNSNELELKIEYSLDNGSTWQHLDDVTMQKTSWQQPYGFWVSGTHYSPFNTSILNIGFLQGESNVKFRFKADSDNSTGMGWCIDNFRIQEDNLDITAYQGDTIKGVNKFFNDFELLMDIGFDNQYANSTYIDCDFYFSTDNILDAGDQFLATVQKSVHDNEYNWTNTFNLPAGLNSGDYYILYDLDVNNAINEIDENNNSNFAVLQIDSTYNAPYSTSFENNNDKWNSGIHTHSSLWENTNDPDFYHMERPKTGNFAWISNGVAYENYFESPFFDLSNTTDNVLCFWYRSWSISPSYVQFKILLPDTLQTAVTYPDFFGGHRQHYDIPPAQKIRWDCHCEDISEFDGRKNFKFLFETSDEYTYHPQENDRILLDDLYIGPPKADASAEVIRYNHFTVTHRTIDTIQYDYFNSGMATLQQAKTNFYWSNDSILDGSDILLGDKMEPIMSDTTSAWQTFAYSKPTQTPGNYYILIEVDADDDVDEMREFDNVVYFELEQRSVTPLPYVNDFETDTIDWKTWASVNKNKWEWGHPLEIEDTNYNGSKVMFINNDDVAAYNSRMHLISPVFDLTQLQTPVLSFDYFVNGQGMFNVDNYAGKNVSLMYTTDGGATWKNLDTTSQSFKGIYLKYELGRQTPYDDEYTGFGGGYSIVMFNKNSKCLVSTGEYNSRDFHDVHRHVIDISHFVNYDQIQFMFIYNNDREDEGYGCAFDNFQIAEASTDLINPSSKNLMVSSNDHFIRHNLQIQNNDIYRSESTTVDLYLSQDSILSGSDHFLYTDTITELKPYQFFEYHVNQPTPSNYGQYNYLLIDIDPNNVVNESNETNNLSYLKLNMDTASNFSYPLLFDFEDEEIDGWAWYHDSTGLSQTYNEHLRMRHRASYYDHMAVQVDSHLWFLDPIRLTLTTMNVEQMSIYYLELPAFDFADIDNVVLNFDIYSAGTVYSNSMVFSSFFRSGGNLEYSLDGGSSWQVLGEQYDTSGVNWYNIDDIEVINYQDGWMHNDDNMHDVSYNAHQLSNQPYVKLRFKYRNTWNFSVHHKHGFRLDNFEVSGNYLNELPPISICDGSQVNVFGNTISQAGIYYDSLVSSNGMDSIVKQEVLVNSTYNFTETINICILSNYTFPDGTSLQNITSNTSHVSQLTTSSGCDSIITTNLNVVSLDTTLTDNGSYFTINQTSSQIQWVKCDSGYSLIPGTTGYYNYTPTSSGSYAAIITNNGCTDTTECLTYSTLSLNSFSPNEQIQIYPNPNTGSFYIEFANYSSINSINLYDVKGALIYKEDVENRDLIHIDLQLTPGSYFLSVKEENGEIKRFKIIIL